MYSPFVELPTSTASSSRSFAEKFYTTRKRLRPKMQEMRNTPPVHHSPQVDRVLKGSIGTAQMEPRQMKEVSDQMRQALGLLDASTPSDPDDLKAYEQFLSGDLKLGLDVDESIIDPVTPVSDMYTQFMTIMATQGGGTHIFEPESKIISTLRVLKPLAVGGIMATFTYMGAMAAVSNFSGNVFAEAIKSNAFLLSLNVMFVASKVVKSWSENDYGGWQTLAAAPLEVLRRVTPAVTGYLLGGVILGFSGSTIGFIIAKLIVDYYTQKIIGIAIKKILVNQEAFDDMIMEQATSEEMIQKMHAEMLTDPGVTASIYRIPLAFRTLIADENLRTVALCAPIVASGLFYGGGKWIDWVIDLVVIRSFLNPALCKLLAQALASKWVKSVSSRACSSMWKLVKKAVPKKLEIYATHYMFHHHLCQIAAILLQNAPLVLLNQVVTMGNMRGGLVSLIESTYMPSIQDLDFEPPVPATESPLATEYLRNPSNTFKFVNSRTQQLYRQIQKDSIRLGRSRLWSISEEAFSKLSPVDRAYMSIAFGEGVHPNGISYADVVNFRDRAGFVITKAERTFLESEATYVDRISRAEGSLNDHRVLLKSVMQAELAMIEKYNISMDDLRTMKTVWTDDIIKQFSKVYQIDHKDPKMEVNFNTAKLSKKYADLTPAQFAELASGNSIDDMSMQQFVTRVYNGGSFDIQSVSAAEFDAWKKQAVDSGDYKTWGDILSWDDKMKDVDTQHKRLVAAMTATPATAQSAQAKEAIQTINTLPAGTVVDASHVTNTVGGTLYGVTTPPDPILPATAIIGQSQQVAAITKIGEVVIASSMAQAVTFAANNRLANIRELVHMMYFGGLDAVTRLLSGIDGGQEINAPSEISKMNDITDQLEKMKNQGVSGCLTYTGKWHLSDGVVVDEAGNKVDEKCLMRPVMGEAIKFAVNAMLNLLSFAASWWSGAAILSKLVGAAGGQIGLPAVRQVLIGMCTARAEKWGCGLNNIPIPAIGGPQRDQIVMCHLNNLILNFLCAFSTGGGLVFQNGQGCDKLAMYVDVRELGLSAPGLASKALDLTTDMVDVATRVSQIGSTWRSYLSTPGLLGEIVGKLGSVMFDAPDSMWPLIAGSTDISTARFSYEQVRSEVKRTGAFATLLYNWYSKE